jgi:predicted phosphodiesterase
MKLGVLSDLHLSRGPLPAPGNDADLFVLAGDIARPAEALGWAAQLGKPALYVPGNHEFYGDSLGGALRKLKLAAAGSAVRVLDNEEVHHGEVRFLGTTLWTDFLLFGPDEGREAAVQEALRSMHDFRRIHVDAERQALFTPLDAAALFRRNAAWLEQRLRTPWPGKTVVITHHAPSARSIAPRHAGSPLNACFASHLDRLLGSGHASVWIHGHMHHSVDYVWRGTRVVCNPRGYVTQGRNENPDFDPGLVIEV